MFWAATNPTYNSCDYNSCGGYEQQRIRLDISQLAYTRFQKFCNVKLSMVCVYALSNSMASYAEFLCYSLRPWPGYAEPGDGYGAT